MEAAGRRGANDETSAYFAPLRYFPRRGLFSVVFVGATKATAQIFANFGGRGEIERRLTEFVFRVERETGFINQPNDGSNSSLTRRDVKRRLRTPTERPKVRAVFDEKTRHHIIAFAERAEKSGVKVVGVGKLRLFFFVKPTNKISVFRLRRETQNRRASQSARVEIGAHIDKITNKGQTTASSGAVQRRFVFRTSRFYVRPAFNEIANLR